MEGLDDAVPASLALLAVARVRRIGALLVVVSARSGGCGRARGRFSGGSRARGAAPALGRVSRLLLKEKSVQS